jgi:uncharacterized damage-inducible protein DinB
VSDLRYPIGRFAYRPPSTAQERARRIEAIADAPARLRAAVEGLTAAQLDTPYRPGGWSVRQVVHHVVDSHLNAYLRIKLALTEDHPTIKPYDEARWAEGADYRQPIDGSLTLLDLLTRRWVALLSSLDAQEFERTFFHPEGGTSFTVDHALAMYAWHGAHHVAHITRLREREGW